MLISRDKVRASLIESWEGKSGSSYISGDFFLGDNLVVISELKKNYQGKISCIYLDPPFDVGSAFNAFVEIPGDEEGEVHKVRIPAFNDSWKDPSNTYKSMMKERLHALYDLLSDDGCLLLHCDYRTTAFFRTTLDELFGPENYVNEIIWAYRTGGVPEKLGFGKKHDTIHYYVKNRDRAVWNPQKDKSYIKHRYGFSNIEVQEDENGLFTMVNCRDVLDIPALRGNQPERVAYPTQKPMALLERLLLATTKPGGIVADFFCGSGTTGVVASRIGRRWILGDVNPYAIHTARKRLINQGSGYRYWGVDSSIKEAQINLIPSCDEQGCVSLNKDVVSYKENSSFPFAAFKLVDAWAVGNLDSEGEMRVLEWNVRENPQATLRTTSSCSVESFPSDAGYAIKVVDVFGNEEITYLDKKS